MAKDTSKDQAPEVEQVDQVHAGANDDTNQDSPTVQEQAQSVLSGEATVVDHGQQSAEELERQAAEQRALGEEGEGRTTTSKSTGKASDSK